MKLSENIINFCQTYVKKNGSCINCLLEKECKQYRENSIRMYEIFKVHFEKLKEREYEIKTECD